MVMGSRLGLEAVVLLKLLKWSLAGMDHLFEIPKKWEHGDPNLTPGDAQFGRGGGGTAATLWKAASERAKCTSLEEVFSSLSAT